MTSTSCNPIYLSKSLPPNTIPLWRQSFNIQFLRGHKHSVHDRTQPRMLATNSLPDTFNNHNSKDSAGLLIKEENEQDCHLCVSDRCYSTPLTTEVMSIAQYRTITPPKSSHSLFLDSLGIVGYGIPMGKYNISHSD